MFSRRDGDFDFWILLIFLKPWDEEPLELTDFDWLRAFGDWRPKFSFKP